jgi:Protein of unknown function (DUF1573)
MRLLLLCCTVGAFFIVCCPASFAQHEYIYIPTAIPEKPKAPAKGLVFDKTKVDFGKLKSNLGVQYATFTGVNKTKKVIRIIGVDKSCGCTAGKILNRAIQPGASTTIQLMLDPKAKGNGRTTQSLTLRTDESISMPYYKLIITADIKVVQMPSFRVSNLIRGQKRWIHSQINAVSPSLATAVIDLPSPLIKVHQTRVDGSTLSLEISTVPKVPRVVTAKVYVRDPTSHHALASIPLFINVRNNYEFNTPSLFLGSMNAGEKVEKAVYMKANKGKVPPIKGITFDNAKPEQATAEVISEPGAPPIIRLTFHPDTMDVKIYRDVLKVKLKNEMQPEATLVLFGRVKKSPIPQKHGG